MVADRSEVNMTMINYVKYRSLPDLRAITNFYVEQPALTGCVNSATIYIYIYIYVYIYGGCKNRLVFQ